MVPPSSGGGEGGGACHTPSSTSSLSSPTDSQGSSLVGVADPKPQEQQQQQQQLGGVAGAGLASSGGGDVGRDLYNAQLRHGEVPWRHAPPQSGQQPHPPLGKGHRGQPSSLQSYGGVYEDMPPLQGHRGQISGEVAWGHPEQHYITLGQHDYQMPNTAGYHDYHHGGGSGYVGGVGGVPQFVSYNQLHPLTQPHPSSSYQQAPPPLHPAPHSYQPHPQHAPHHLQSSGHAHYFQHYQQQPHPLYRPGGWSQDHYVPHPVSDSYMSSQQGGSSDHSPMDTPYRYVGGGTEREHLLSSSSSYPSSYSGSHTHSSLSHAHSSLSSLSDVGGQQQSAPNTHTRPRSLPPYPPSEYLPQHLPHPYGSRVEPRPPHNIPEEEGEEGGQSHLYQQRGRLGEWSLGYPAEALTQEVLSRQLDRTLTLSEDTPAGQSDRDVPAGQSDQDVPAGQSDRDVPAGQSNRDVPAGDSDRNVPAGQSDRDVPTGQSDQDVPPGRSIRGVPTGQSIWDVPTGQSIQSVLAGQSNQEMLMGQSNPAGRTPAGQSDKPAGQGMCATKHDLLSALDSDRIEIVEEPQTISVEARHTAVLTCRARALDSAAMPTLQWYRGEELLVGETRAELVIEEVEKRDAGLYCCVATHPDDQSARKCSYVAQLSIKTGKICE